MGGQDSREHSSQVGMRNKGSLSPQGFQDQRGYPTREMDTAEETGPSKREEVTPRTDNAGKTPQSEDVPPPREGSHPLGRGGPPPSSGSSNPQRREDENQEAIPTIKMGPDPNVQENRGSRDSRSSLSAKWSLRRPREEPDF